MNRTRTGLLLLMLSEGLASCGGSSPTPTTPSFLPSVTAISVTTGSTGGGTPVTITGTGFEAALTEPGVNTPGTKVTIGGVAVKVRFDKRFPNDLYFDTPAHAAGAVDVVVMNTGGQTHRLPGAYIYAPPESFDFNGTWSGFVNEFFILFTIQNNALISASCEGYATVTFPSMPSVGGGEFSFFGNDGVGMSGRIVSASYAVGTSSLPPPCGDGATWRASKR